MKTRILQTIYGLLFIIVTINLQAQSNPVAYYQFNETSDSIIVDVSGNSFNGYANCDTCWEEKGKFNGAFHFQGVHKIDLPAEDIALTSEEGTMAFWVLLPPSSTNHINAIWWAGEREGGDEFGPQNVMHVHAEGYSEDIMAGGEANFFLRDSIADQNYFIYSDPWKGYIGNPPSENVISLADSVWHHVACTWDWGGNLALYIDGEPVWDTTEFSPDNVWDINRMTLGVFNQIDSRMLNGYLDEFRMYGYALNAGEVYDLANPYIPPPGYEDPINVIVLEASGRDSLHNRFLKMNGINVTSIETFKLSPTTSQDTFDLLNAADVIILGRSIPSTQYRGINSETWMDSITAPVILNSPFAVHDGANRLNWFGIATGINDDIEDDTIYGTVTEYNADIFANVSVAKGDSVPWMYAPHGLLAVDDMVTNSTIFARNEDNVLIMYGKAGEELYLSGPTPAGDRMYFGFGNNHMGWENMFPLSPEAQQVYLNAVRFMAGYTNGNGYTSKEVITITPTSRPLHTDATLSDLKVNGISIAEFTPSTYTYTITLFDYPSESPIVTATATDEKADTIIIKNITGMPDTAVVTVIAEDGETELVYKVFIDFEIFVKELSIIKLEFYPNPAKNTINFNNTLNIETIEVYSLTGEKLLALPVQTADKVVEIDIKNLSTGFYFIRGLDKNGFVAAGSFANE